MKMKTKTEDKAAIRLVLRCADDYGRFRCYLCHTYATSACALYRHMRRHTLSHWRNMLPKKLECCTAIVVRHKLPNPTLFDSDDEDSVDAEECLMRRDGEAVDLMKVLPAWNATGQVKKKRGRADSKNAKALPSKKLKVADEVVSDVMKKDEEVVEAGGNVVFDVDLNEDPVNQE